MTGRGVCAVEARQRGTTTDGSSPDYLSLWSGPSRRSGRGRTPTTSGRRRPNGIASVCSARGSPNTSRRRLRKVRTCSSRAASSAPRTNAETAKARKRRPISRRSGAFAPTSCANWIAANRNPKRLLPAPRLRVNRWTRPTQLRSSACFFQRASERASVPEALFACPRRRAGANSSNFLTYSLTVCPKG